MGTNNTKITVKDVYKIYQSGTLQQRIETVALRGISLEINDNDFVTVMGPSGSGKTTLLNVLGGLDTPSAGDIIYKIGNEPPVNITKLTEPQLDSWRHNKIGVLFQSDNLLHHLTALENVQLPLKFLGYKNTARAKDLLIRLGLENRLYHRTYQLSAGERQRVALAAALVYNPAIIYADEPTGELDSYTLKQTMDLFAQIHKEENIIFFVVTHNPAVARYGNRYFTLEDGRLQERDEPFSYDDFSSVLGEYVVRIDKYQRLLMPYDLIKEINLSESIVGISIVNKQPLELVVSGDIDSDDIYVSQVDQMNRILLPRQLLKEITIPDKPLTGIYDEDRQLIILKSKEKERAK